MFAVYIICIYVACMYACMYFIMGVTKALLFETEAPVYFHVI